MTSVRGWRLAALSVGGGGVKRRYASKLRLTGLFGLWLTGYKKWAVLKTLDQTKLSHHTWLYVGTSVLRWTKWATVTYGRVGNLKTRVSKRKFFPRFALNFIKNVCPHWLETLPAPLIIIKLKLFCQGPKYKFQLRFWHKQAECFDSAMRWRHHWYQKVNKPLGLNF